MLEFLKSVPYILLALVALMIMITVHELGHYLIGKAFKFNITEFAIGFGRPLFKKQMKSGEIFSFRWIPMGGFCAFKGEDEVGSDKNDFNNKPCWQRIIVLLSGVTFNFIFAIIILMIYFSAYGFNLPQVAKTYDNGQIEQVLQQGDIIMKIDGKNVYAIDFSLMLSGKEEVLMVVERNGEQIEVVVKSGTYNYENADGTFSEKVGFGIHTGQVAYKYGFFDNLWRAMATPFKIIKMTIVVIGQLITGVLGIKGALGGPLTTIGIMSDGIRQMGFQAFLYLVGFMSVSLAFMNVLPLPALDGSRVVFVLIEWIRGKPIKREIEGKIHFVGLIVLFGLTILIDLLNLFG